MNLRTTSSVFNSLFLIGLNNRRKKMICKIIEWNVHHTTIQSGGEKKTKNFLTPKFSQKKKITRTCNQISKISFAINLSLISVIKFKIYLHCTFSLSHQGKGRERKWRKGLHIAYPKWDKNLVFNKILPQKCFILTTFLQFSGCEHFTEILHLPGARDPRRERERERKGGEYHRRGED